MLHGIRKLVSAAKWYHERLAGRETVRRQTKARREQRTLLSHIFRLAFHDYSRIIIFFAGYCCNPGVYYICFDGIQYNQKLFDDA